MYQEILINVEPQEKRVAIVEDKRLEEFYVERQGIKALVGNIYKGTVESIVPAIGAAFVNIGLEKNGFLYVQDLTGPDYEKMAELIDKPDIYATGGSPAPKSYGEIKNMLKIGQQILVQVVKEPVGTKGARLTTHISLPGRFLVLMPCDHHLGISRRIQNEKERTRLKDLLRSLKIQDNMGLIVRTAASGSSKGEFIHDLRFLTNLWRKIKAFSQRAQVPALVHEEYDLLLRIIRDNFTVQTNRLIIDSKDEYKRIMRFLAMFLPRLRSRVQWFGGDLPLFEKRGVEDEIAKIYERRVFLKSGGHIIIEPTESLTAIDVNSAKFVKKKDPEETALLVNLEAAKEIARQIRLRDIGGIIIIDFIDMKPARNRQRVFDSLAEALKRDHAKTDVSSVSDLGLVEMTRQRVRKSLESVVYQACPYCQGKGIVKSASTMAIAILRKAAKLLQGIKNKSLLIYTHPSVASYLLNENRQAIFSLENKFRTKILVKEDFSLHIQDSKIEPV